MRTQDRKILITDTELVPGHTYEVVVRSVTRVGRLQPAESAPRALVTLAGKTLPPISVSDFAATASFYNIFLTWTLGTDPDIEGVEVWRNTISDFATSLQIATIKGEFYTDNLGASGITRYYWVRVKSRTGLFSAWSAVASATTAAVGASDIDDFAITATKLHLNTIVLTGDTWTDYSPSSTYVAWGAHTVVYGGVSYPISAGNTNLAYVYWVIGGAAYSASATHPTLGTTRFMIAINTAGVHTKVWNSAANMVIGTAFIANAAITYAKIADLAVDTAKIAALAVDAAKIANLTVTGAKIADATIANAKISDLAVSKLTAGTISSKAITLAIAAGTGDSYIAAGKSDFDNTVAGFILGCDDSDSDKAKFYIGGANNYVNWDGMALNVKGVIMVTAGSNVAVGADVTNAALQAGTTITGGGIILSGGGSIHTVNKDGYADTTAGIWLGFEGAAYTLGIGDATKFITWDGVALTLQGLFRTAASGYRMEIDNVSNTIRGYNIYGTQTIAIDGDAAGVVWVGDSSATRSYLWNNSLELKSAEAPTAYSQLFLNNDYADALHLLYIDSVTLSGAAYLIEAYVNSAAKFSVTKAGFVKAASGIETASAFYKSNIQVVGAQGAAVADATDAASVITQLNLLLARCRAHGLIAAA